MWHFRLLALHLPPCSVSILAGETENSNMLAMKMTESRVQLWEREWQLWHIVGNATPTTDTRCEKEDAHIHVGIVVFDLNVLYSFCHARRGVTSKGIGDRGFLAQ